MPELCEYQIGQSVELSDGRTATVRFAGSTHFAAGEWVGVELDDATGKNDGEVQGQRYFACPQGYGMFIRPNVATIIDQPTPKPAPRTFGKTYHPNLLENSSLLEKSSSMPGGSKRQSVLDPRASKRESINAGSPTPAARPVRLSRLTVSDPRLLA